MRPLTGAHGFDGGGGDGIDGLMTATSMTEDIAFSCEAENDLFFIALFLVHFYDPAGDEINPGHGITFAENKLALFEL
jgi:hypothetical protein